MIESYPHVLNLGHRLLEGLFTGNVVVQEKVDGSQLSVVRENGEMKARSNGAQIDMTNPPKLFARALEALAPRLLEIPDGYILRGECIDRPKHNTLTYGRVPAGHFVLFDIQYGTGTTRFASPEGLQEFGEILKLEVVPLYYYGRANAIDLAYLQTQLERESFLGGCKIEGVVIKNYDKIGEDGKILVGKLVSPAFKEVHNTDWKLRNPNRADVIEGLLTSLTTEARWQKAVQHLSEQGLLAHEPKDIGLLVKEVQSDVLREEEEGIKQALFRWAKKQIEKGVVKGLPEWYKTRLMEGIKDENSNTL